MKYTNHTNIPLSMAVWLASDEYDHDPNPKAISATGLIKPVKQTILASRIPVEEVSADTSGVIASRLGTAFHNAIEQTWKDRDRLETALEDLGYPKKVIEKIRVNPTKSEAGIIPVYMELRTSKKVGEFTVSGKFDFVAEGILEDFKSTSTYTYENKTNDEQYKLQGSMYRWLNPNIITADHMNIQYLFTDWKPALAQTKNYPPSKILTYRVPLMSVAETELYVKGRINLLKSLWDKPQEQLPACTPEELWQKESTWKYYKDPNKTARSTKNFNNAADAHNRLAKDGGVGIVKEVKGQAVACRYCPAFNLCQQKNQLILEGRLTI